MSGWSASNELAKLLDGASPLALSEQGACGPKGGRGLPQSKTLSRAIASLRGGVMDEFRNSVA